MKPLLLGQDSVGGNVELSAEERQTHMHIIGASGSGKSKYLEQMMRGDLANHQGFCLIDPHGSLYEDVLKYCAHRVLSQEVVLLNLSEPSQIIGFNPFKRAEDGDVSVQVARRIGATLHAWGVRNADQTPTLERTLRLIFTTLLELGLSFHQVQHLINFDSGDIRDQLVERLTSPLIRQEWRELAALKPKDWRTEMLSAKNRLFRLLTSETLARFLNSASGCIDLSEIIEKGKILLVNLAPSKSLSDENGRVFGSLLVNEFFEVARSRDISSGKKLKNYYLYLDEFQTFVSLDLTAMLDQVRKYKLFTILAHQRFGQLDDDMTDAVLTNCRIKAVFGGLPVEMARMMAQELCIGNLDPLRVKHEIYQTKFWPRYSRDRVYSRSTSRGQSLGTGENSSSGLSNVSSHGMSFGAPEGWFSSAALVGTSDSTGTSINSIHGEHSNKTDFDGTAESESDVPILLPEPFKELSSVQYFSLEEQLHMLTTAIKEQQTRQCFIKIHNQTARRLLVPLLRAYRTSAKAISWYEKKVFKLQGARSQTAVDEERVRSETELLSNTRGGRKSITASRESLSDLIGRE